MLCDNVEEARCRAALLYMMTWQALVKTGMPALTRSQLADAW